MSESFKSSSPLNDTFKSSNLLRSLDMSSKGNYYARTSRNIDKLMKIVEDEEDIQFQLRVDTQEENGECTPEKLDKLNNKYQLNAESLVKQDSK